MDVVRYEQTVGPIVLDPSQMGARESPLYFPTRHPHLLSPQYALVYEKKAHLVIRLLQFRIGLELLVQVGKTRKYHYNKIIITIIIKIFYWQQT